jgi:excinuclease ABC subunit C
MDAEEADQKRLESIRDQIASIPNTPGVYLLRDSNSKVIYIGKAKQLKARLRQHFQPSTDFTKSRVIRESSEKIEVFETRTENEALLLEFNLIQEYDPPLNTRYTDDKSYPYVEITTGEKFPRIFTTRERFNKESIFLGPFSDVKSTKKSIKYALQMFPIADCKNEIHLGDSETWAKSCIRRLTNQCMKPCEVEIDSDKYRINVKNVINFLEGKLPEIIAGTETSMKQAAESLDFEEAIRYRDILKAINKTMQIQSVIVESQDTYVLVVHGNGLEVVINLMTVKDNRVIRQDPYLMELTEELLNQLDEDEFNKNNYDISVEIIDSITDEIITHVLKIIGSDIKNVKLKRILNGTKSTKVYNTLKDLGFKPVKMNLNEKELIKLASHNAKQVLQRRSLLSKKSTTADERLQDLKELINLKEIPDIIDCFDVSTLQGNNNVASCIRFQHAKPLKKGYRRFKIRTVEGQDDFASMEEVVFRRYRDISEGFDQYGLPIPNLIIIDGGKEQLKRGKLSLKKLNLEIPIIGLAKREEEIYLPTSDTPIKFDENRPGMLLVKSARDEAHRFAVEYQRKSREKEGLTSLLDSIEGIGEKRKFLLMKRYKSIDNIAKESAETLRLDLGIPEKIASQLVAKSRSFMNDIDSRKSRRRRRR